MSRPATFVIHEHDAEFRRLASYSSIIHKLQDGWGFSNMYLQARHRHPSMGPSTRSSQELKRRVELRELPSS